MKGDTFVTFRGEPDVLIEYDVDFSGPGSGAGVDWGFADKRQPEPPVTTDEEDAITAQCVTSAEDRAFDWDD